MTSKSTGSYYTPKKLAEFILAHALKSLGKESNLRILEPSCGDGVFLRTLQDDRTTMKRRFVIDAIEKDSKFGLAYFHRGNAQLALENPSAAADGYTQAITLGIKDKVLFNSRRDGRIIRLYPKTNAANPTVIAIAVRDANMGFQNILGS